MKILLVNPQKLIEPPIGFLSIAAVLERDGHSVSILEIPIFDKSEKDGSEIEKRLTSAISSIAPDIVGVTCTSPDSKIVRQICAVVKRLDSKLKLIVGGIHPTVMPEETLSWGPDIIVIGEGEETIRQIIEYFRGSVRLNDIRGIAFIEDGRIITTAEREVVTDLDSLPLPAYHLLDEARFLKRSYSIRGKWLRCAAIVTSRGCFGRCTFCASSRMHKRAIRWMGVSRIMDEIDYFIKRYRIEGLYISDDSFTLNRKRVFDFCEEIKRRNINISWACQSRVGALTDEMLERMKNSGLIQIEFGVESGSQRVLEMIGKDIRVEDTIKEFELCHRHGVRTLANVIIGIPGETMDDILKTKDLVSKIRPDFTAAFFCTPFPGTAMYDEAVNRSLIRKGDDMDWGMITEPFFATDMPKEDLVAAYDALQKENSGFFSSYLKDHRFLADMLLWTVKYPALMFNLLRLYAAGRRCEAQNLFLHIFRKHHLNM